MSWIEDTVLSLGEGFIMHRLGKYDRVFGWCRNWGWTSVWECGRRDECASDCVRCGLYLPLIRSLARVR